MKFSKNAVLSLLQKIEIGQLEVIDTDASVASCGNAANEEAPRSQLKVLKDAFWVRVLLFADMVSQFVCRDCTRHVADGECAGFS